MAANKALNLKFIVVGQPDGTVDADVVRSRRFRQTAVNFGSENLGDMFKSGDYVVAAKIPDGFIPSGVVVNVIKANAGGTLAVSALKGVKDLNALIDPATLVELVSGVALNAVGKTYGELTPTSSSSAVASGGGTPTITTSSKKWISNGDDYLVIKSTADVDAEFEVVLIGDYIPLED